MKLHGAKTEVKKNGTAKKEENTAEIEPSTLDACVTCLPLGLFHD